MNELVGFWLYKYIHASSISAGNGGNINNISGNPLLYTSKGGDVYVYYLSISGNIRVTNGEVF